MAYRLDYIVNEGAGPVKYTYSLTGSIPHRSVGDVGDIDVAPGETEKIRDATTNLVFESPQLHIWMKDCEYADNGLLGELSIPSDSAGHVWTHFNSLLGWLLRRRYVPFNCNQDPGRVNILFHIPTEQQAAVFTEQREVFKTEIKIANTARALADRGAELARRVGE